MPNHPNHQQEAWLKNRKMSLDCKLLYPNLVSLKVLIIGKLWAAHLCSPRWMEWQRWQLEKSPTCRFIPPVAIFKDLIVAETNKELMKKDLAPLLLGELHWFIGIWLFMATLSGFPRRQFWSVAEIDPFDGAPYRFSHWMTYRRFEEIRTNLVYTNQNKPMFKDKFWEIYQIVQQWNENMKQRFSASWVSCLFCKAENVEKALKK